MTVGFAQTITPGVGEPLLVSIGREALAGSEPVEDVYVEFSPTDGTVSPSSDLTDAQGEVHAIANITSGATSMGILVQAFDQPGGLLLAEELVSATSTVQPPHPGCELDCMGQSDVAGLSRLHLLKHLLNFTSPLDRHVNKRPAGEVWIAAHFDVHLRIRQVRLEHFHLVMDHVQAVRDRRNQVGPHGPPID
jgi:hypothetical protein